MAALGLARDEIGLGVTKYGYLVAPVAHVRASQRLIHQVSNSATHPVKELGRLPVQITATLELASTSLVAFLGAVETATVRHFSFVLPTGDEAYYHVTSGDVTGVEVVNPTDTGTQYLLITASFVAADQRLYKGADDSVLLGA